MNADNRWQRPGSILRLRQIQLQMLVVRVRKFDAALEDDIVGDRRLRSGDGRSEEQGEEGEEWKCAHKFFGSGGENRRAESSTRATPRMAK